MKIFIAVFLVCAGFAHGAAAGEENHQHGSHIHEPDTSERNDSSNARCEDQVQVNVNGLVCDFCARALEKVFGRRDEVSGIHVDLDRGVVIVSTHPGQKISDADVKRMITESGYSVVSLKKEC